MIGGRSPSVRDWTTWSLRSSSSSRCQPALGVRRAEEVVDHVAVASDARRRAFVGLAGIVLKRSQTVPAVMAASL